MWSTVLQPPSGQRLKLPYHVEYSVATTFRPEIKTTLSCEVQCCNHLQATRGRTILLIGSTVVQPPAGQRLKLPYYGEYSAATTFRPETKTILSCGVQCCNHLQATRGRTILLIGSTVVQPPAGQRLKLPYCGEYSAATTFRPETKTILSCEVQCGNHLQARD